MPATKHEPTLSQAEAHNLAMSLRSGGYLRFTNLANKRMVVRECKLMGINTYSHTAHGSLLDPRYTVEGSHLPDEGFNNNYKQFQPKLYCLETSRW